VFIPSRLVCDPVRGRGDDEEEMIAGASDEDCRGGRSGVNLEGGIPPLLDVLEGSEGWVNLLEIG
jgi:hypothetical protein